MIAIVVLSASFSPLPRLSRQPVLVRPAAQLAAKRFFSAPVTMSETKHGEPIPHSELPKRFDHDHDHDDHDGHDSHDHGQGEHDHGEGEHDGHAHSELHSTGAGFVIVFIVLIVVLGAVFVAAVCCQDAAAALLRRRARLLPSYTTAARPKWV